MLDDTKLFQLDAAARAIANAKVAETDCSPALVAAEREVERLDGCLRDLDEQRAAIAARRAVGKPLAGDGGDLLLIQMDTEQLSVMRARAADDADRARAVLAAASAAITAAQANFERVQRRIEHTALHEHLAKLLILSVNTLKATSDAFARVDPRDLPEARRGLPDVAAAAEALLVMACNDLKNDSARMGGSRCLWGPSEGLQRTLEFLIHHGPARQGGY